MKSYESIDYFGNHWGIEGIAFDKLDGSNIRIEYNKKNGFIKFGTRNNMFTLNDKDNPFAVAGQMFLNKYEFGLKEIFKTKDYREHQTLTCFAELVGNKSAFGQHDFSDSTLDIILFDIFVYKKNFVSPKQFVKDFQHLGIPKIVYEGNLNKELVEDVKGNAFDLTEGVIFKSKQSINKRGDFYYCKIKTDDWFEKLRSVDEKAYLNEIKTIK